MEQINKNLKVSKCQFVNHDSEVTFENLKGGIFTILCQMGLKIKKYAEKQEKRLLFWNDKGRYLSICLFLLFY